MRRRRHLSTPTRGRTRPVVVTSHSHHILAWLVRSELVPPCLSFVGLAESPEEASRERKASGGQQDLPHAVLSVVGVHREWRPAGSEWHQEVSKTSRTDILSVVGVHRDWRPAGSERHQEASKTSRTHILSVVGVHREWRNVLRAPP